MQMRPSDITTYKKFHKYVSLGMPEVVHVTTIINEIKKQSEQGTTISTDTIKDALLWGKGPVVVVEDMPDAGRFTPGTNEIKIRKFRVEQFEAGKGLVKTPKGRLVYYVGVILLHELTHWADDQDGIDNPLEEGDEFEKAIYGGVVHAP